jgi:hypothetical protein
MSDSRQPAYRTGRAGMTTTNINFTRVLLSGRKYVPVQGTPSEKLFFYL